jgi:hypothetical protein
MIPQIPESSQISAKVKDPTDKPQKQVAWKFVLPPGRTYTVECEFAGDKQHSSIALYTEIPKMLILKDYERKVVIEGDGDTPEKLSATIEPGIWLVCGWHKRGPKNLRNWYYSAPAEGGERDRQLWGVDPKGVLYVDLTFTDEEEGRSWIRIRGVEGGGAEA